MSRCLGTTKAGWPCRSSAMNGDRYCFAHHPDLGARRKEMSEYLSVTHRQHACWPLINGSVFELTWSEIDRRIKFLTPRQIEALEFICSGKTFRCRGEVLGIGGRSFENRLWIARAKVGAWSRAQLIAMFAIWKAGAKMT